MQWACKFCKFVYERKGNCLDITDTETWWLQPPVKRMLERWPALFRKQQVFAEFTRVASKDLEQDFFEALDRHTPRFLEIFKSRKGIIGSTLADIVAQVEIKIQDITAMWTAVLRCLPGLSWRLGREYFKVCFDSDTITDFIQVPDGLLTVIPEDSQQPGPNAIHFEPSSINIILEGNIMENIENHAQAICLTFELLYNLHLDYPKRLENTFDLLNLGVGNLSPK